MHNCINPVTEERDKRYWIICTKRGGLQLRFMVHTYSYSMLKHFMTIEDHAWRTTMRTHHSPTVFIFYMAPEQIVMIWSIFTSIWRHERRQKYGWHSPITMGNGFWWMTLWKQLTGLFIFRGWHHTFASVAHGADRRLPQERPVPRWRLGPGHWGSLSCSTAVVSRLAVYDCWCCCRLL